MSNPTQPSVGAVGSPAQVLLRAIEAWTPEEASSRRLMASVGVSSSEASVLVDPLQKVLPDSQRAPRASRDAKRADLVGQVMAALPAGGSERVLEARASFADRIRRKQVQRAMQHIDGMHHAAEGIAKASSECNALARKLDPGLFREASALALKTKGADGTPMTQREILDRALEVRISEPSLAPMRHLIRKLADNPEMAGARLRLQSLAATFERNSSALALVVRNVGGNNPKVVAQLARAVEVKMAPSVGAVPKLDVEAPSESPNSGRRRVQGAFDDFCSEMHGMARDIDAQAAKKRPAEEMDGPDARPHGTAPVPRRR